MPSRSAAGTAWLAPGGGDCGLQQLDGPFLAARLAETAGKLGRNGVLLFRKGALKRLFHVPEPTRK